MSSHAQAGFSEKWGVVSLGGVVLFFVAIAVSGGVTGFIDRFRGGEPSPTVRSLYGLTDRAELHYKAVASEAEIYQWRARDHIWSRVAFLCRPLEGLVDRGLIRFDEAVRREDLVVITRFYDLVHCSGGDVARRQRADRVLIERYLDDQLESELELFRLSDLIRVVYLEQSIGDEASDTLWTEMANVYGWGVLSRE